ncbi:MAG: hypothetical protein ACI80N_003168 [Gammaproteobacteria bacterium]|jgi:hypothetical protein
MFGFAKRVSCPACGSRKTIPIVYGMPGMELIKQVERGQVVLGGCLVGPDQPDRRCRECEHSWNTTSAKK